MIFNGIVNSAKTGVAKWPTSWKLEYGTPIPKIPDPKSEDDLRIISLTAFYSKVFERFVVQWLMKYIGHLLDPKQFGGLKQNSTSHYMIELINFILYNQDYDLPIAVLVCTVDFSKAFNRQNHAILITKLSDMGVPGWLLHLIMGFLSDRSLVVNYNGVTSSKQPLPGGTPQGTLLGLILFLVLINPCLNELNPKIGPKITQSKGKFQPTRFHAKYVDDLTIAEAFNMKEALVENTDRPQPDLFRARTGLKLCPERSMVYDDLRKVESFAIENEMQLNLKKTKFMVLNPSKTMDFLPEFESGGSCVETVENMKLLGFIISSNLSWKENSKMMVRKAYQRLWAIKRLKAKGADLQDLLEIYEKQVRSILEYGVPVWNSSISTEEVTSIERVQKAFLHIALGNDYQSYENALETSGLEPLQSRRTRLCYTFAKKALKNSKHSHWFQQYENSGPQTRSIKPKLKEPLFKLRRYEKSPIPYLTRLINKGLK